jgi:hypothetical protein
MVGAIGCNNLLTTAARGLAAGQGDLGRAAGRVLDELDPATVDARLARARIHAAVAVVHTADDMLGTSIDAVV